jgi:MFS family permease
VASTDQRRRAFVRAQVGGLPAMSGAGSIVAQLVSGVVTDRIGRRAVLTFGTGLLVLAPAIRRRSHAARLPGDGRDEPR